jgi:hypothetical protein
MCSLERCFCEGLFPHRQFSHHFAGAFQDRFHERLELRRLAFGFRHQACDVVVGDAEFLADLHMMGEFVFRLLQPADLEDRKLPQPRIELALEADESADAVEGPRHVRRVDQELVQIGVALEHVAIFGRDLVGLEIGQAGHTFLPSFF